MGMAAAEAGTLKGHGARGRLYRRAVDEPEVGDCQPWPGLLAAYSWRRLTPWRNAVCGAFSRLDSGSGHVAGSYGAGQRGPGDPRASSRFCFQDAGSSVTVDHCARHPWPVVNCQTIVCRKSARLGPGMHWTSRCWACGTVAGSEKEVFVVAFLTGPGGKAAGDRPKHEHPRAAMDQRNRCAG